MRPIPRLVTFLWLTLTPALSAQIGPPSNGPIAIDPGWHAIVGVRAIVEPGTTIENATILIREGRIVSVVANGPVPDGARRHDRPGTIAHAAFVDPYVPIESDAPTPGRTEHWHPLVQPESEPPAQIEESLAKDLREIGYGAAMFYRSQGAVRGRGVAMTLETLVENEQRRVLTRSGPIAIAHARAERGEYPSSLMGSVALLRQTFFDALALSRDLPGATPALSELGRSAHVLFVASDELDLMRGRRLAEELGREERFHYVGTGTEYRRSAAAVPAGSELILPLAFPKAPDVASMDNRERVTLRQLLDWELAPTNPARLRARDVSLAFTTYRLEKRGDLVDALRQAIRHGLSENDALAGLTTEAAYLGFVNDVVGRLGSGMLANVCLVEGSLFGDDRRLLEVWVAGRQHVLRRPDHALSTLGNWSTSVKLGGLELQRIEVQRSKKGDDLSLRVFAAGQDKPLAISAARATADSIAFLYRADDKQSFAVSAHVLVGAMQGRFVGADGNVIGFQAVRSTADAAETNSTPPAATEAALAAARESATREVPVPLGAFGRVTPPKSQRIAISNATVWTASERGILENATIHVADGRITFVGPDSEAPAFDAELTIDATKLHVTPGLIDCHSHTGILGGVNEGTQAVTAEVRVGDVLDPDDIDFYRQLAGGVTCVNQLHGSANPIGGQSQTVKLRFGIHDPEAMKFAGARPGIKFALGENVKRSRASSNTRYPNTRMGVEAMLRDRFHAASAYADELARRTGSNEPPPRRDLELEALMEVLRGERLVHCHSYRQDEILALCRVAKEFGFRIGTLQHCLEGYKVAEIIKDSAIGASIFSDWWAYKYEVFDAIPENAAIMTRVGVSVSLNSDSDELARRLNTEAAKAVKYGGLSREQAIALVTINPATQLGIEARVGSIEVGKDADLAIWSGDPLSYFSVCDRTILDGAVWFSRDEDRTLRDFAAKERERLIQRILAEAGGGSADAETRSEDRSHRAGECGCYEGVER
jgi:imidazolonepropionase-like amidohydrolase